jgi:bacillithiol biosynthesis deacetylase BshB1
MKIDVLAIAAHPDDVELGCSGVLLMEKKNGKKIGVVDLTRGELGTRGTAETRLAESIASTQIMQLDARENLELPDAFFQNNPVSQLKVIAAIRKYRPEIVLTNAPSDRHPDHGRAAKLVGDSAFYAGLIKIETFENGMAQKAWRPKYVFHFIQDRFIQPDFVFDITAVMEQKIATIRAFKSQFDTVKDDEPQTYISTPAFLDSIIYRAKMLGKMIGVEYAEGFITDKMVGINNFDTFIQHVT